MSTTGKASFRVRRERSNVRTRAQMDLCRDLRIEAIGKRGSSSSNGRPSRIRPWTSLSVGSVLPAAQGAGVESNELNLLLHSRRSEGAEPPRRWRNGLSAHNADGFEGPLDEIGNAAPLQAARRPACLGVRASGSYLLTPERNAHKNCRASAHAGTLAFAVRPLLRVACAPRQPRSEVRSTLRQALVPP